MLVIPIPCLGVDRLPKHCAQTAQVPLLHVETAQEAYGGGGGAEMDEVQVVLLDGLPAVVECVQTSFREPYISPVSNTPDVTALKCLSQYKVSFTVY
jgi:hypothetical protein